MARSARIYGRLARLEQDLPERCPACAGRPELGGVIYKLNGQFQTGRGEIVTEADLARCRVCGNCRSDGCIFVAGIDPAYL